MYYQYQNNAAKRIFRGLALINKPQEQYENEQKQKERCFLEYVCNLATRERNEFFLKYEKINGIESLEKLKQKARDVWKLSQKDRAK